MELYITLTSVLTLLWPGSLALALRARILRYLLLGWRPNAIALEVHYSTRVIYNIE